MQQALRSSALHNDAKGCPVHNLRRRSFIERVRAFFKGLYLPKLHVWIVSPYEQEPGTKTGHSFMPADVLAVLQGYLTLRPEAPFISLQGKLFRLVTHPWDERKQGPLNPEGFHDLSVVLMSVLSTGADRAATLANECVQQGIRLICGGYHTTALPEHLLGWANIVWVGEITQAELLGALEKLIQMDADEHVVMKSGPHQAVFHQPSDYRGIDVSNCLGTAVRGTVGCPWDCSFCGACQVSGKEMRTACPDCFEWTLKHLPRIKMGLLGWLYRRKAPVIRSDDNALQRATPECILSFMEMAKTLHDHGFKWVAELCARTLMSSQHNIDAVVKRRAESKVGQNEKGEVWDKILTALKPYGYDLYRYVAAKGAIVFYFGIEELRSAKEITSKEGVQKLKKLVSVEELHNLIQRCHAFGISVAGAFVLGLPSYEGKRTIDQLLKFSKNVGLDAAQMSIRTPTPGSNDFWEAVESRDIRSFAYRLYDCSRVLLVSLFRKHPDIESELQYSYNEFYSLKNILARLPLHQLLSLRRATRTRIRRGLLTNISIMIGRRAFLRRWNKRPALPAGAAEIPAYVLEGLNRSNRNAFVQITHS